MKRIILDHFRRWGWLWIIIIIGHFILCWFAVRNSESSKYLFLDAVFISAWLLSFDLQRGYTRVIPTLPLSVKQIAHTYWHISVTLPAITLALVGVLSAGISRLCHPAGEFNLNWLAANAIFNAVLLGVIFFILTGLHANSVNNWWGQIRSGFFGALWGLSFAGGFVFFQHLPQSPAAACLFFVIGTLMSIAGWFRAKQLVWQRAGFRPPSQRSGKRPAQYRISNGFNGVPLLLAATIIRTLLIWLVMVAFLMVFAMLQDHASSPEKSMNGIISVMANGIPFWFIIVFQTFPILTNLRFLRTLPLSTTRLAIIMVTLPVVSVATLAGVSLALAIPIAGAAKSYEIVANYSAIAAFIAWCIPLAVWQGFNRQTMYLMLFVLFLGAVIPLQFLGHQTLSLAWIFSISMLLIIAAIWLTQRLLNQSRNAYRSWPNPLGGGWGGWNWGR